jgi:hypothetical protein
LFRTAKVLFDRDAALWAATSYFMSPVCIQGVLSMDVADTSLLPLFSLLIIHSDCQQTLSPHIGIQSCWHWGWACAFGRK